MKSIIITGHKNPDTDSIVSALIFSEFLKIVKKPLIGFSNFRIKAGRAGTLNKETKFILDYFKQKQPVLIKSLKNKNVILVDHAEYGQAIDGIEKAEIIAIIDHHKLGGIRTAMPIFYRAEPLGSTATILAKMFLENDISITKKTAGLILAAILSDTLKLTSPTTTKEDERIVKILVKISKENINKLSEKMFKAKSDIKGISSAELVSGDYKEYKSKGVNFGFGVWETTNPQAIKPKKQEIFCALKNLKKKRKMSLVFFSVVDILQKNSEIFLLGEQEKLIAEKIFKKKSKENLLFLPDVVSRKKQMAPPIINFLENK